VKRGLEGGEEVDVRRVEMRGVGEKGLRSVRARRREKGLVRSELPSCKLASGYDLVS
jgi:hypothetical protein